MKQESENLAERLRGLYHIYGCEHELPGHDDLVAKIDSVKPEIRRGFQQELDRGDVYPFSRERAAEIEDNTPLYEKIMMCWGMMYVPAKILQEDTKDLQSKARVFYATIRDIPSVVKKVFLTSKEENIEDIMECNKALAELYFETFKANVEYELNHQEN